MAMHVFSSVLISPQHVQAIASVTHHTLLEAILHGCYVIAIHMIKLTCSTMHIKCGVIYNYLKCLFHQFLHDCYFHVHSVIHYTNGEVCILYFYSEALYDINDCFTKFKGNVQRCNF